MGWGTRGGVGQLRAYIEYLIIAVKYLIIAVKIVLGLYLRLAVKIVTALKLRLRFALDYRVNPIKTCCNSRSH